MSGAEGQDPAGTGPIDLQLPRSATSSGTPQTSTTQVTRLVDTKSLLQVTPYHGDKTSFFLGNGPSRLQCEHSVNHFMKDSRKLKTT